LPLAGPDIVTLILIVVIIMIIIKIIPGDQIIAIVEIYIGRLTLNLTLSK